MLRARSLVAFVVASLAAGGAFAQSVDAPAAPRVPLDDATGGAYTAPTTLFTPAAALPRFNARVTLGADVQPTGVFSPVRPLITAELGLPAGFTLAAGTTFFGGDQSRVADEFTPFVQVRYHIFGRPDGHGWQVGVSLTGKRVGYNGGDAELEASFQVQYRARRWEVGAQGTFGQSLTEADGHDIEARVYAAWRVIPSLALGVAVQTRADVGEGSPEEEAARAAKGLPELDFIGGALASWTYERWQLGALAGASTIGFANGAAFIGQAFGTVRF